MSNGGVLDTSGSTPVGTGRFPITPYVVGPSGQAGYQTIQSAINAASAAGGGVVYIQPGTYTENLVLADKVDLYGTPAVSQNESASVTIIGTHTPSPTGHNGFNSICFISTTDAFSSAVAGTTHIVFLNCESAIQNGYLLNLPNWAGILEIYDFNPNTSGAPFTVNDGGINNSGGSPIVAFNAGVGFNGSSAMNISGSAFIESCELGAPVNFLNGSDLAVQWVTFAGKVTFSGNATGFIYFSSIMAGTSAAITMNASGTVQIFNSTIDSTNNPAINGTGAGTLQIGDDTFVNNSNISGSFTVSTSSANLFGEMRAGGDKGGSVGFTSITNANATSVSTGTGTVKMSSANSANSSAWIKIYIGTTTYWVPAWTNNAP